MITFDDFTKIEMQVGEIEAVKDIEGSHNLLKLIVDFGNEKRQAIAGLKKYYSAKELEGKKFIFVTNLQPRKVMGLESNCMILAAEGEKGDIVLLQPEKDIAVGSKIR